MALNAGFQYLEQRDTLDNIVKAGVVSKKEPFANSTNTGIYDIIAEDLRYLYENSNSTAITKLKSDIEKMYLDMINNPNYGSTSATEQAKLALSYAQEAKSYLDSVIEKTNDLGRVDEFITSMRDYMETIQALVSNIEEASISADRAKQSEIVAKECKEYVEGKVDYFDYRVPIMMEETEGFASSARDSAISARNSAESAKSSAQEVNSALSSIKNYADNANTSAESALASSNLAHNSELLAKGYSDTAEGYKSNAKQSENNAQVWAEGDDTEVEPLNGEHSSKGWANLAKNYKDDASNSALEAKDYAEQVKNYMGFDLETVATKGFVNEKIGDLIGGAPETLDTLNELAEALGNDSNFASAVTSQLASKADTSAVYTKDEIDGKLSNLQPPISVNTTGSGDVITSLSYDGGVITASKSIDITNTYTTKTELSEHNSSPDAHADIREAIKNSGSGDLSKYTETERCPMFNKRDVITTSGIYTTPVTGWYKITAKGGGGGGAYVDWAPPLGSGGGEGATNIYYKYFSKDTPLRVLIGAGGEKGETGSDGGNTDVRHVMSPNFFNMQANGGKGGTLLYPQQSGGQGGIGLIPGASGQPGGMMYNTFNGDFVFYGGTGGGNGGGACQNGYYTDGILGGGGSQGGDGGNGYVWFEYFDPSFL